MEITKSNLNDDIGIVLRSDPAKLIESVRKTMLSRIEEINSAADLEIKKIDEDIRIGLDLFRSSQQKKYEDEIEYEESRMRNLSAIEMKKQKLDGMELFIKKIMDEAAALIRKDSRYPVFLKSCVTAALKDVRGGSAAVLLSPDDMIISEAIMNEIKAAGYSFEIRISADDRLIMGGAMVADDEAGVVYNNSVERIIYRKNDEIRREIVRGLKECLTERNISE